MTRHRHELDGAPIVHDHEEYNGGNDSHDHGPEFWIGREVELLAEDQVGVSAQPDAPAEVSRPGEPVLTWGRAVTDSGENIILIQAQAMGMTMQVAHRPEVAEAFAKGIMETIAEIRREFLVASADDMREAVSTLERDAILRGVPGVER